jgi:RimJ/RimL family protein N-acetyltransferase
VDPDVVATAERVALRRWRASDSDAVFAICQDPDIQWWTTVPVPYTRQDALDYVVDVAGGQWRTAAVLRSRWSNGAAVG